uniref:Uncharacterized protein n=1 Tax=Klebsiella pneumoniae TaxID=573 RepID=A0A8B0SXY0_KLEPN|nr:hypothetical protein [Klebsiella pneumoniae]
MLIVCMARKKVNLLPGGISAFTPCLETFEEKLPKSNFF